MNALIGYSGFIGGTLIEYLDEKNTEYYNSSNIEYIRDKSFDTVYCSGLYAEKWKINKNPEDDLISIKSLQDALQTVKCKTFVLISTVDIFDCEIGQMEDDLAVSINTFATHPYGKHRYQMEQWCKKTFENCFILRLPALFGKGLKKNALYDMLNLNNIDLLRSHWRFQWYNLDWLYNDIQYCILNNINEINCVLEPITLELIQTLFFPQIVLKNHTDKVVNYKLQSKYFKERHTLDELLISMKEFIEQYGKKNILVSELAWPKYYDFLMEKFLSMNNIHSLEAVPSKNNWDITLYKSIYSIQSLLFNNPINIFQEQNEFIEIIKDILEKIVNTDTKVLVFGSPKNRYYNNEEYMGLFHTIGDICSKQDIIFCVEHNSSKYDCNWMTRFNDTYNFVKELNHPNIKVNLDLGNLIMENERLPEFFDISYIGHVQISFPYLSYWDNSYNPFILETLQQIKRLGYNKMISLEMKFNDILPFKDINKFIKLMNQV